MKIELIDSMGDDSTIVNSARVSFSKDSSSYTSDQNTKLIKYLAKHSHWTPFAHVQVSCRVKIPVFMARQYFKHIVGSVKNEMSRRYISSPPEFWYPESWRSRPSVSIKQGSGEVLPDQDAIMEDYNLSVEESLRTYNLLLDLDVCPEQARAVLPQSMYTEFIDTASLVYWARIYRQRTHEGSQKEWEPLCEQINDIMKGIAPVAWKCLTKGED